MDSSDSSHNTEPPYPQELLCQALAEIVGEENVLLKEPLAKHTTFKVGGPAALFVIPSGINQTQAILDLLSEQGAPSFILGRGSDLVMSDEGFPGVVVDLSQQLTDVSVEGTELVAQAGVSLIDASEMAAALSLSGLEFACGIPGTIGGAIYMNAGAYEGCIADDLKTAKGPFAHGTLHTLPHEALTYGYSMSKVRAEKLCVLSATFELTTAPFEKIRAKMEDYTRRREEKQPLDLPSAGSVFKRPPGYFAGKLIGDAGLSGFRIGGIQVSEKHNGFIVNVGGGTASEVLAVVKHVQAEVRKQFGVELEPEIQFLGSF